MTNAASQILIVDDEPSLLKMMSVYLERLGYGVVTAGSTEKAWAAVEAAPHAFALALLDATMSGIGMQDLAARILAAKFVEVQTVDTFNSVQRRVMCSEAQRLAVHGLVLSPHST